jgi:hypothetical protein
MILLFDCAPVILVALDYRGSDPIQFDLAVEHHQVMLEQPLPAQFHQLAVVAAGGHHLGLASRAMTLSR